MKAKDAPTVKLCSKRFSQLKSLTQSTPTAASCETNGGLNCVFPFTYQGENFETCTKKNAESFWCGTKVDSDGNQIYGQWDYCSGDCSEFPSIKELFLRLRLLLRFPPQAPPAERKKGGPAHFPSTTRWREKGLLKYQIPSGLAINTRL